MTVIHNKANFSDSIAFNGLSLLSQAYSHPGRQSKTLFYYLLLEFGLFVPKHTVLYFHFFFTLLRYSWPLTQ